MHHLIACIFCGGDPTTDSFLLQTAIAGGVAAPWMLRGKVKELIGRTRTGGQSISEPDGQSYPDPDGEEPPSKAR